MNRYFVRGDEAWGSFDHFWVNHGYLELNYALWRRRDSDAYRGPFRLPGDATPALVVNTTYDPATPYRGGLRLVRDLRNARLLTMRGTGTRRTPATRPASTPRSRRYVLTLEQPAPGTVCRQDVDFTAPGVAARRSARQRQDDVLRAIRVRGR